MASTPAHRRAPGTVALAAVLACALVCTLVSAATAATELKFPGKAPWKDAVSARLPLSVSLSRQLSACAPPSPDDHDHGRKHDHHDRHDLHTITHTHTLARSKPLSDVSVGVTPRPTPSHTAQRVPRTAVRAQPIKYARSALAVTLRTPSAAAARRPPLARALLGRWACLSTASRCLASHTPSIVTASRSR